MVKKKALGKGLDALFLEEGIDFSTIEKVENSVVKEEVKDVPLEMLRPNPYQPRTNFDAASLNDLTQSIKEHGVFQPIIIKKSIKGYEIVAGERRFRASKLAGLTTIPAVVRNFSDRQMMEIALLENLQREDLNGIEEANAYNLMLKDLDITQEELSKRIGKSRVHITNLLGLLKLPKDVQSLVIENKISTAHARTLSKFNDVKHIRKLAKSIVDENLSVREIEKLRSKSKPKADKERDVHVVAMEEKLCELLNTKVVISDSKIAISYSNLDNLNDIIAKLSRE